MEEVLPSSEGLRAGVLGQGGDVRLVDGVEERRVTLCK